MIESLLSRVGGGGNGPIPGSPTLIAGDANAGWYGEVPTADLIDGVALAAALNLVAGTPQNSTGPWLKFAYNGKILFVARNTFRYAMSWDQLQAINVVDGSRIITVGGTKYRIRLLKGGDADYAVGPGREWDALMLRVHTSYPAGTRWAAYTDAQMSVTTGNGFVTWCYDFQQSSPGNKVTRGNGSVSAFNIYRADTSNYATGWRPVLELVP